MTECTSRTIHAQAPGRREFVARFDGGDITSYAGILLLGAVEERRRIVRRFAECFTDYRSPDRIEHTVAEIIAQRVYSLALGYEDVNDHDALRLDPLLAAVVGKVDPKGDKRRRKRDKQKPLAAPSTIHRLELSHPYLAAADRYRRIGLDSESVDQLLMTLFLESYDDAPESIVVDFDATDDRIHGDQQGRFFSRLLRQLLLSAAICIRRRSLAGRAAANVGPGRCGPQHRRA